MSEQRKPGMVVDGVEHRPVLDEVWKGARGESLHFCPECEEPWPCREVALEALKGAVRKQYRWKMDALRREEAEHAFLVDTTAELDASKAQVAAANAQWERAERNLTACQRELAAVTKALADGEITTVGASFRTTADAVAETIAELRRVEAAMQRAEKDVAELQNGVEFWSEHAKQTEAKLEQAEKQRADDLAGHSAALAMTRNDLSVANGQIYSLTQQLERVEAAAGRYRLALTGALRLHHCDRECHCPECDEIRRVLSDPTGERAAAVLAEVRDLQAKAERVGSNYDWHDTDLADLFAAFAAMEETQSCG